MGENCYSLQLDYNRYIKYLLFNAIKVDKQAGAARKVLTRKVLQSESPKSPRNFRPNLTTLSRAMISMTYAAGCRDTLSPIFKFRTILVKTFLVAPTGAHLPGVSGFPSWRRWSCSRRSPPSWGSPPGRWSSGTSRAGLRDSATRTTRRCPENLNLAGLWRKVFRLTVLELIRKRAQPTTTSRCC